MTTNTLTESTSECTSECVPTCTAYLRYDVQVLSTLNSCRSASNLPRLFSTTHRPPTTPFHSTPWPPDLVPLFKRMGGCTWLLWPLDRPLLKMLVRHLFDARYSWGSGGLDRGGRRRSVAAALPTPCPILFRVFVGGQSRRGHVHSCRHRLACTWPVQNAPSPTTTSRLSRLPNG